MLDLGCGGARHTARALAAGHRYTGIDISAAQLELARRRLPRATFLQADAVELELEPASFDAVVSLFMFGHVPREEQEPLLRKIATWLRRTG